MLGNLNYYSRTQELAHLISIPDLCAGTLDLLSQDSSVGTINLLSQESSVGTLNLLSQDQVLGH